MTSSILYAIIFAKLGYEANAMLFRRPAPKFVKHVSVLLFFLCLLPFLLVLLVGYFTIDTSTEIYQYDISDVKALCARFQFSAKESFCAVSGRHSPIDFKRALASRFVAQEATYDGIMPYLKDVRAFSVGCVNAFDDVNNPKRNSCPKPAECDTKIDKFYSCDFVLPGSVMGVGITFDKSSGTITDYAPTWPGSNSG